MNEQPRVEWRGRFDFAAVAEAIGVPTDMIMAVHSTGVVLWTDKCDADDDPIWWATVRPDADGILVVGPRHIIGTVGEFNARLKDAMRDAMGESPDRG